MPDTVLASDEVMVATNETKKVKSSLSIQAMSTSRRIITIGGRCLKPANVSYVADALGTMIGSLGIHAEVTTRTTGSNFFANARIDIQVQPDQDMHETRESIAGNLANVVVAEVNGGNVELRLAGAMSVIDANFILQVFNKSRAKVGKTSLALHQCPGDSPERRVWLNCPTSEMTSEVVMLAQSAINKTL